MRDTSGRACVVTVVGDLTGADTAALREEVGNALRGHPPTDIVIDLRDCDVMDDGGLEAILFARRLCEARGGRFKLTHVGPDCRTILRAGGTVHR
jgi:anti-anti-sigma factor